MHLAQLRIESIALVDTLDVELPTGLIAITGETGAGKSMILAALGLLTGQRADLSLVRNGDAKGRVEGVFDFSDERDSAATSLRATLVEQGLECEDGEPLILRRELSHSGRSTASVAGRLVNARQLSEIADHVVDIHSQHDQQSLVQRRWQREALDAYAGAEKEAATVREAHEAWQSADTALSEWRERERELRQREDLLRFQLQEIDNAALADGEEEELLEREILLANAEEIGAAMAELAGLCEDEEHGILTHLQHAQRLLSRLSDMGAGDQDIAATLKDATVGLNEVARYLDSRREEIEVNPAELSKVQDRLHVIDQLKKKYGSSVAEVKAYGVEVRRELEGLGSYEERVTEMEADVRRTHAQLLKAAKALSKKRNAAGPRLARAVEAELQHLGMEGAHFEVRLEQRDHPGPTGAEEVEFRIAANPGSAPDALSKVASGGELSRVMLALKCVASSRSDVPILVFDEIDAGISGTVAHAVATRLDALAARHQALVITHMPQIACRAATQFVVEKHVEDGRTTVSMRQLSSTERETELARMLGGESTAARAHARELLGRTRTNTDRHGRTRDPAKRNT